ncbi:uncharacterized protein LOC109903453 [Oncorhynchus kisutch]|uniref:uncharacterized protein LOC109903453 n=1 Tax=Oncorhynchus kisutch TaxID=8019 RepID=UPI0009A05473|nr:uncharacterized protein LOC109903453 [Oncorhynchus kisutch]XP_020355769.1 uncharacterized protein LOC109903453 [Oncorhynchus kisutch]
MDGIVVEVLGVPNILASDRMVDKLTIHFLRPRNGGGEVQRVLFPSDSPGQAFVIFEEPEVAAHVSRLTHVLEVDQQQFCLKVRIVDRPEVDMPVKATLDVRMLPNDREVRRLLDIHGFKVNELRHGQLRVQGSFLKLRAVKAQLHQDNQPQYNPSPPSLSGHASGTYKASTRMHQTNGTARHAGNMSPMYAGSRSPISVNGEQFAHVLQSSSPTNYSRDSGSPCSLSSPRSDNLSPSLLAPGYGANVTHRRNPSPSRSRSVVSFLMDADVLRYAQCVRKKDIDTILGSNNIQMNVQPSECSNISSVSLEGKNPKTAMEKLQDYLTTLNTTLRTQEIPLGTIDHNGQVRISKLIQKFNSVYPTVLVNQVGDILRLVGPSRDSYDMMQILLGKPLELPPAGRTGRALDRGSRDRRSSSLSSLPKRKDAPIPWDPAPVSAAVPDYSPSKYQGDSAHGRTVQRAGSPVPYTSTPSHRGRSHSDSQEKVKEQRVTQRDFSRQERVDDVVVPSAGAQMPVMKKKSLLTKIPTNKAGWKDVLSGKIKKRP